MSSISVALRATTAVVLLAVSLVVSACGSSEADGEVTVLGPADAVDRIRSGDYVVVDLRSVAAFEAGHVRGALSMPAASQTFAARLDELDREEWYVVYSRNGEVAQEVADRMATEGFEHVVDAGAFGMLAIAGAPVE